MPGGRRLPAGPGVQAGHGRVSAELQRRRAVQRVLRSRLRVGDVPDGHVADAVQHRRAHVPDLRVPEARMRAVRAERRRCEHRRDLRVQYGRRLQAGLQRPDRPISKRLYGRVLPVGAAKPAKSPRDEGLSGEHDAAAARRRAFLDSHALVGDAHGHLHIESRASGTGGSPAASMTPRASAASRRRRLTR